MPIRGAPPPPRLRRVAPELERRRIGRTRVLLTLGELLPATSYLRAQNARRSVQLRARQAFEDAHLDALVAPATPFTAKPLDVSSGTEDAPKIPLMELLRHSMPANALGLPSLAVPCGFDRDHLPIGMQVIGRPFGEPALLRIGHAYQTKTQWHRMHPPI